MYFMKYHEGMKYYVFKKYLMKETSFKMLYIYIGYICTYIHVDSVNSVYIHYEYVQLQITTIKTHSGLNTSEFGCFTKQKVHGETVQS